MQQSASEAETPEAIARLKRALGRLSPDVPRGNGSVLSGGEQPAEDYWLGVIWSIAGLGWSCGESIAREWSQGSSRYDPDEFTKDWSAYNPYHPNPVGIGSLYKLAKAHDWLDHPTDGPSANLSRYRILNRNEILAIPPTGWRVKGVLPMTGLAAIYGPSGSGKSFLALDLAFAIAGGNPWFDHRTAHCPVTYIMLEGEAGLRNRVAAWEKHHSKECPCDFGAVVQPFGLMNGQDLADLAFVLPKGGLVIIDTLNRAAPTADENASADMGMILQGAKHIQEVTGGLVILVHHTGKDAGKGPRGHSSLYAALDAAIEVERSASGRSWKVSKAKDGEDGTSFAFALRRIGLGADNEGDEISSCVVERDTADLFTALEPSGKTQRIALRAVRERLASAAATGKGGSGAQTPCITVAEARTSIAGSLEDVPSNRRNNRAKGLLDKLVQHGLLRSGDEGCEGWVWEDRKIQSQKSPLIGGTDFLDSGDA